MYKLICLEITDPSCFTSRPAHPGKSSLACRDVYHGREEHLVQLSQLGLVRPWRSFRCSHARLVR